MFKPTKYEQFEIQLPFLKKNLKKELERVKIFQDTKQIPITYQLDTKYIYLSYEDSKINEINNYQKKYNRIMAIDLNPNYIGYSIIDWIDNKSWKLVTNGIFDLTHFSIKSKELKHLKYELKLLGKDGEERTKIIRDKILHLNGQRDHETIEIVIRLFNIFKRFNCSLFGIEKLNLSSKDNLKGKRYNRLVINEWLRNNLVNQLEKRLDRLHVKVVKVLPNYSSFIGNLLYSNLNLPDPILSSIEINRRTYEFNAQYIEKTKVKSNVIIFPSFDRIKDQFTMPLEGYSKEIDSVQWWKWLYGWFKNMRVKYRITLESVQNTRDFSKICIKNKVILYNFI